MQQRKIVVNKQYQRTKITLKPVGKLLNQTKKRLTKKSSFQPIREQFRFDDEVIPKSYNKCEDSQERQNLKQGKFHISKKLKENHQIKFNFIEDPRQSDFSYRKFILIEKILLILSIFYFTVAVIDAQMYILDQRNIIPQNWNTPLNLDIVCSIFTLLLIFTILIRYVCINQLQIDQKKFYCIRKEIGIYYQIRRFFHNSSSLIKFILEVCILIPHPLVLFHQSTIQLFESYNEIYLNHRVNDLLILTSLIRIYIVMRSMINLTIYSSPRASRLCNHNRIQHSFLYSVKCLLKQEPVKIICLVFLIQQITLGLGLKLSEGSLIYNNPQLSSPTGFQNYINCYWCIFITMATVGYGDYYPKTTPGRIVGLFSAISGIILSSLLIVSLSAYLTMQGNQSKSHLTLARLQQQQQLKQQASQAFISTLQMTKYMSTEQKYSVGNLSKLFTALKHKIDLVKFRTRKIKSLVNNNNIIQQMNRLFQLFKDSLQQSFRCQLSLKESLQKLTNSSKAQRKMQTIFMSNNMELLITNKL